MATASFDWRDWAKESERVKLGEDADGDGKADVLEFFAEGFRTAETGNRRRRGRPR